jgi:hypothetical protein
VGVESSELSEEEEGSGNSGSSEGSSSDCRTRSFIAMFSLTVAFDAAPVPLTSDSEAALATPTEKSEATASETSGEESEGG